MVSSKANAADGLHPKTPLIMLWTSRPIDEPKAPPHVLFIVSLSACRVIRDAKKGSVGNGLLATANVLSRLPND